MEGSSFGDVPLNVELKLEVWDSPNSAGIVIDAVRLAKLALNNGVAGALEGPSALPDEVAAEADRRRRGLRAHRALHRAARAQDRSRRRPRPSQCRCAASSSWVRAALVSLAALDRDRRRSLERRLRRDRGQDLRARSRRRSSRGSTRDRRPRLPRAAAASRALGVAGVVLACAGVRALDGADLGRVRRATATGSSIGVVTRVGARAARGDDGAADDELAAAAAHALPGDRRAGVRRRAGRRA